MLVTRYSIPASLLQCYWNSTPKRSSYNPRMKIILNVSYTLSKTPSIIERARIEKISRGKYLVRISQTRMSEFAMMIREKESKELDTMKEVRKYLLENADEEHKDQFR